MTRHYSTMPLEAIANLRVPAAPNSLLLLWTTAPMLQQALLVMRAWGFSYRTSGAWTKPGNWGTGQWRLRNQHELFLLGRRGRFPRPLPCVISSVIHAPRGRHSQKPEQLQDLIEHAYPGLRYLELFARRPRDGWVVWGNEVPAPPSAAS